MPGLIDAATAILSASERRLEVVAHNVANLATPGFKRQSSFTRLLAPAARETGDLPAVGTVRDFAQGKLSATSNPLDLAISGPGFFELRAGDGFVYSRQGQFHLTSEGKVVNAQGYALQQAGGGDLVLRSDAVSVSEDGTVIEDGVPIARLAVFAADPSALEAIGESHFTAAPGAMEIVPDAIVRQGMVENSNVEIGGEMVAMMASLRQSESGARLVQVYDDLLGRAISTFGGGR